MTDSFHFGLEAEFMLASSEDFSPMWHQDITFKALDKIFEKISLNGIPSLQGLDPEPPHKKLMPFVVEGYGITDKDFNVYDAYPKGIEIRTPVCDSLAMVMDVYEELFSRVKQALSLNKMVPVAISHHPVETKFSGPQNKRRHDYWLWAMEVMTTYGPDINVSFPEAISKKLFADIQDLHAKVNYYSPAMAAISLASPFYQGKLWETKSVQGKSFRTFKRSVVAPAIELHLEENFRIEFKVFDMTNRSSDFRNYFLLVLALFLDEGLKGRSSDQERIYDSGNVAREGLNAEGMRNRFVELFVRAPKVLRKFGFDPSPLQSLVERIEKNTTPADEMIAIYQKNSSIQEVIRHYSSLQTLSGKLI